MNTHIIYVRMFVQLCEYLIHMLSVRGACVRVCVRCFSCCCMFFIVVVENVKSKILKVMR